MRGEAARPSPQPSPRTAIVAETVLASPCGERERPAFVGPTNGRTDEDMGKITDILKTMEYGPSPEASDAVRAWLAAHKEGFGHFIGGGFAKPGALVRRP